MENLKSNQITSIVSKEAFDQIELLQSKLEKCIELQAELNRLQGIVL